MKISESKAKQYIEDIEVLKGMSKREFLDRAQDVLFDSYDDNDESTINFWDAIEEYGSEDIFKLLDEDGDGVLGEDEINKFNELDGDDENLSLYDLENIMTEIEATEAATATNSSGVTTYGNSNPNTTSNPDAGVQARTPEQIESEIQTKEEQKAQVQTDTQNKVNEIETQMTTELQALGGEIAQQIAQFEADDAKLDGDIAKTNQDINTQQVALQTANANASAQQDAISRYGSQIQSLQAAMSQEGADTAGLSAKIANLEAAKGQAEANLLAAQAEAEQAQIQIDILEAQKIQLEADKVALKEKLIQANQDNEEVKRIVEAAQNQITEIQNNEKTQISSIDSEIQALRTELAKAKQEEQVSKTLAENANRSISDPEGLYQSMGLEALGMNKDVFMMAMEGYNNLTDEQRKTGYLGIFDTTQNRDAERYYLLDLNTFQVVERSAMKTGSGDMSNVAGANKGGSHATLSGFEIVAEEYYSSGMGKRAIRLDGIEMGINNNSRAKGTVVHYTTGNSTWGCKGFPPVYTNGRIDKDATYAKMRALAPTGAVLFTYPSDVQEYEELSALV